MLETRILKLRATGLPISHLAARSEVPVSVMHGIMTGKRRRVSQETMDKIDRFLNWPDPLGVVAQVLRNAGPEDGREEIARDIAVALMLRDPSFNPAGFLRDAGI